MKKKFILLAMMLLTLIGGVNLNVLNAQEDVVTINGDATSSSALYPIGYNNSYSLNQHVYAATSIDHDEGVINAIAFKRASTTAANRNIKVYLKNTDVTSLSSYESFSQEDQVFYSESFNTAPSEDGWLTISLGNNFTYEGGNILLVVIDNTGSMVSGDNGCCYATKTSGSTFYGNGYSEYSETNFPNGWSSSRQPALKLYFEPASDIIPADPTNLAVVECTHNSVSLTWDAAENADKYNVHVYNNGVEITGSPFTSTVTAYTVKGLDAETTYTFKVRSVCGSNLSENFSNEVNATTLEYNDPFAGKLFRIKVMNGSYAGSYLNVNSHDITEPYYYNDPNDAATRVGVSAREESNRQIFTITDNGEGKYYLRDADGYLIKCDDKSNYKGRNTWDVDAYSTTVGTPLWFDYFDGEQFYIRDYDKYLGNGSPDNYSTTNNYFKVQDGLVYCNAPIDLNEGDNHRVVLWSVEEVLPEAPAAPTVYANAISATAVQLSWDAVFGADTYTVYEGTTVIAENITETNYTHEGLTASTTYNYTVTATNEIGTSEVSNTATATTWAPAPETAPANLQATKVTHNSVTLTWDAVDGATYYEIYKDLAYLDQVNTSTYTATGLNAETSYSFTVKAGNISGISPVSEALSVTTEQFIGRTVVFELNDYYLYYGTAYYDGWNNNKLSVVLSTGEVYEYTNSGSAATEYYYLDVPYGTTVTVTYLNIGSYPYENTYYIRYSDDNSLIYQDGRAVNGGNAPTANSPFSFIVERPAPKNLVANPSQIYPDQTTTLTWEAYEGAASYNIYVNSELKANTTEISYELSGLTYNVNGNTIEVIAVDENGTEISGKASVTVQVAGTFTLTVNVTDGTNPIKDATVNIDMAYAYDEFKNQISPVTVEPTGADGKTTVELLRLPNEGFYNDNGDWVYPFYTVEVLKSPYQKQEKYINPGDVVTNGHTMDFVLALPTVSNIKVQDPAGNDLHGDVMEGTDLILSWDAVEGADSYKVYTFVNGEVKETETTIDPKCYIENVVKGYEYAVSALFGDLESEKYYANLTVKGNGYFKGYVTYGTNALEGIQVKVSSEYGDVSAVATTNEDGYFIGEIMEGENYKLTISHSDYEEYILENITIIYNTASELGTIQLTAKPSASGITEVTATLNGENVVVNWTVDEAYTKYNVYRRLAGTQGKGDNIAQDVAVTSYTDAQWETLEPGTYQYGVSAFVEPQAQKRGTEVIFEEGFETTETNEVPEGWYKISGNWRVTNYSNSGGVLSGSQHLWTQYMQSGDHYLVMPAIAPAGATLSFVYRSAPFSGTYDDLTICYSTSQDGPWTKINDEVYRETSKTQVSIPLDNIEASTVYIAFCMTARYADGIYIDDVVVTREKTSLIETQIVWSDAVVKQGPATFIGGDTEKPTAWNVNANWSTGSVPADGADVIINADAVITSEVNVASITINKGDSYPYNTLTVADKGILTVTGTISQQSDYLLVLEEGGQIFQNNANVTARFRMSIDNPSDWSDETNKDGWQFISMPMADVTYDWFTGADDEYDLYKYDGSQELEWLNHKADSFAETEFISGKGYLASLKEAETATVYGTLNTSTYFSSYFAYNADKDLANFRLIGNPFTYDIKWGDMNPYQLADGFAIVNKDGNYEYYSGADAVIKVGQGFFIKAIAGESEYSQYYYSKQRSTRESNNSLNITATGNAGEDNVIINLAGKSEGFNKLQNFNDAIATVYVAEGGKNYGIYNCDADVQEVELNFNANQMGNYTISIQPNGKFQTVTLVDRFTGIETNMLLEDYSFTAMSNENNNRFIVKLAVSDQQSAVSDNFVYQSGEDLIIDAEGTVQIIDVMGRVLLSDEVESTNNRINVSGFQNGTYMVRVINGSEVKVEKVVIY